MAEEHERGAVDDAEVDRAERLLDGLTREEIADLFAFMESDPR